jgi:DNA-binding transcriptional ArsR family regulator
MRRVSLTQVLKSPMRVRILELLTMDAALPAKAVPLAEALTVDFPEAKPDQVNYHLAILKDARLIPTG